MAFVPSRLQGDVPKDGHLAIRMGKDEAMPVPVGAGILAVYDPTRPDKIEGFLLAKVTPEKWVLRCTCNAKCKHVVTLRRTGSGSHNR